MSSRLERANSEIQKAIQEIILFNLKDPRFSEMITVTGVKTSPDFKYAKVSISILSKDEAERKELFDILKGTGTFIRTSLVNKIRLPQAPRLDFVLDEGHIYTDRINQILENLTIPPLEEEEE